MLGYKYIIYATGNFKLEFQSEIEVVISERHARALIMMLAVSRDQKRSRDWLKSRLWGQRGEKQASDSLRQALFKLKKSLEKFPNFIQADNEYIWLVDTQLSSTDDDAYGEFFEDAPVNLGESFDDWLRQERSNVLQKSTLQLGHSVSSNIARPNKPCIVMAPTKTLSDTPYVDSFVELLSDQILDSLKVQGFVNVFDLRDLVSNQFKNFTDNVLPFPDIVMQLKLVKSGSQFQVTAQAKRPADHRILWMSSLGADQDSSMTISPDQLSEFGNQIVDAVTSAVFSELNKDAHSADKNSSHLFSAVHQIMSFSRHGQLEACNRLNILCENSLDSIALAWRAFIFAIVVGENFEEVDTVEFSKVEEYCIKAIESGRSNALTNALVGHVYGFVLRRIEIGHEYLKRARKIAPYMAIAWDLSAMNELYLGNSEKAYEYGLIASRLGRFNPYKPFFDATLAMSSSVLGKHYETIAISEKILSRRPNFLPVMRHLSASLAHSGQIEKSRALVTQIQELDPKFQSNRIADPTYALPSKESVKLIDSAFKKIGLLT